MGHVILHVVTSHKAPTLRLWRETSWIAWEFSEHQNLLFWLLTLQLRVNDASSKNNSNFLISYLSSLETIAKNVFDILYVVALHGSINAGYSLQNFHWLYFHYACFAEYCKWAFLFSWIYYTVTLRSPALHDWSRIFGDHSLGCSSENKQMYGLQHLLI